MKKIFICLGICLMIFNSTFIASADNNTSIVYLRGVNNDEYSMFLSAYVYGYENESNSPIGLGTLRAVGEDLQSAFQEYLTNDAKAIYFRIDGYDTKTKTFTELAEVSELKIKINRQKSAGGFGSVLGNNYSVYHFENGKISQLEIVSSNLYEVEFLTNDLGYFVLIYNDNVMNFTFMLDENTIYKMYENLSVNDLIELPESPKKKGYVFDGWYYYTQDSGYPLDLEEGMLLRDVGNHAYARWRKISESSPLISVKYTVTFVTEEGMLVEEQTVEENTCASEPQAPTRDGFEFAGWYTDKELNEKYDFDTPVTAKTYLYAAWESVNDTEKDTPVSDNAETNNTDKITSDNQIIFTIDKTEYTVFGISKQMDVSPKIVNNLTMLPARYVAEALGATVEWNDGTVTITKDETVIEIYIGKETATVNGEEITLLSPAFIETDRTYCPVRFICESLGADVDWDEENRVVTITKK